MTLSTAVLRPGDWVHYDGSEHQVLALAGTSVRLRTVDGAESVVLAVTSRPHPASPRSTANRRPRLRRAWVRRIGSC